MEKLNKLEQEIYDSFPVSATNAKGISKFCMKRMEKAFDAGKLFEYNSHFDGVPNPAPNKEQWIKNEIG